MTAKDIKKMSTVERLQSMEELWDVLCHEDQEIESPAWHGKILADRKKKIKNGEAKFISIKDLKFGTRK